MTLGTIVLHVLVNRSNVQGVSIVVQVSRFARSVKKGITVLQAPHSHLSVWLVSFRNQDPLSVKFAHQATFVLRRSGNLLFVHKASFHLKMLQSAPRAHQVTHASFLTKLQINVLGERILHKVKTNVLCAHPAATAL